MMISKSNYLNNTNPTLARRTSNPTSKSTTQKNIPKFTDNPIISNKAVDATDKNDVTSNSTLNPKSYQDSKAAVNNNTLRPTNRLSNSTKNPELNIHLKKPAQPVTYPTQKLTLGDYSKKSTSKPSIASPKPAAVETRPPENLNPAKIVKLIAMTSNPTKKPTPRPNLGKITDPQNHFDKLLKEMRSLNKTLIFRLPADIGGGPKTNAPLNTPDLPPDPELSYNINLYRQRKAFPGIYRREDLGKVLEYEGLRTGVQLGVQAGVFAQTVLNAWKSCTKYVLVNSWAGSQAALLEETKRRLRLYERKYEICRNSTWMCAKRYRKERFDMVFMDARYDYKGVLVDLADWWSLVKENGIMAGHNFVHQNEALQRTHQDWTKNFDGTVDPKGRAVRGAVEEFFGDKSSPERFRTIYTVREKGQLWPTWFVRK